MCIGILSYRKIIGLQNSYSKHFASLLWALPLPLHINLEKILYPNCQRTIPPPDDTNDFELRKMQFCLSTSVVCTELVLLAEFFNPFNIKVSSQLGKFYFHLHRVILCGIKDFRRKNLKIYFNT